MGALEKVLDGPAQRRHPDLEVLCDRLERIIHGRAAEELIAAGIPAETGIVALPVWLWAEALIGMGRKDFDARNGGKLLMPVRIEWESSPVLAPGTDTVELNWRARGAGHRTAGQARIVHVQSGDILGKPEGVPSLSEPVFTASGPAGKAAAILQQLADDGKAAVWEIVRGIESHVERLIHTAHAAVSHEIGLTAGISRPVLDETGLQQVLDRMMLGWIDEKGVEQRGSVFRLIDLCTAPGRFVKVDPLMYMTTHLRRDAEAEIRRSLDDPHIGPKIREVARRLPDADIHRIIEEYRRIYPGDRLAAERAEKALSVQPDLMAASVCLSPDMEETLAVKR